MKPTAKSFALRFRKRYWEVSILLLGEYLFTEGHPEWTVTLQRIHSGNHGTAELPTHTEITNSGSAISLPGKVGNFQCEAKDINLSSVNVNK